MEHGQVTDHGSGDVVVRDGCVHWHACAACEVRDSREGVVAYRVSLRDAWSSCLVPCPECAGSKVALAADRWGDPTPVERARLTLPVIQDLVTGVTIVPTSAPVAGARRLPPLPPEVELSATAAPEGSRVASRR
ncbi:hypothetical protein V3N99_14950 [Dermatophilaceae bacterium Soc4.6]